MSRCLVGFKAESVQLSRRCPESFLEPIQEQAMEPAIASQIIIGVATIVAGLGGYVLAGLNERSRDLRAINREEITYLTRRTEESENRRRAFQLDNLLELQDAVHVMARLSARAMHSDHMQAREKQYAILPTGWSEEMQANRANVYRLVSRVLDDDLRFQIRVFTKSSAGLSLLPKDIEGMESDSLEGHMFERYEEFSAQFDQVMRPLGDQIRALLAR